jgi:ribosomal protein S27AE
MSVVYPTHHCFDDAVEFCERRARAKHPSVETTLRLVHGIILVPADQPAGVSDAQPGERAIHAWAEDGDLCWDAGILEDGRRIEFAVAKAEYYEHYRVQETTVYTMPELLAANKASGHYGPWRPEYAALCRVKRLRCPRCGSTKIAETVLRHTCSACGAFGWPSIGSFVVTNG